MSSTTSEPKGTLLKEFSKRLSQACDDSADIPEYGKGRQVVIATKMEVSQEAARKWFSAEAMPKPAKMKKLADLLEVDRAWLALGEKPEMSRDAKKLAGRVLEGAVHMVAGTLQLAGANCAFPSDTDPRKDYVDIYAIVRGKKLDVHVSTAVEVASDVFQVVVPREYADITCIGFFPAKSVRFHLLELTSALIDRHKVRRAGDFTLTIDRNGTTYTTGADEWPRFKPTGGST